MTNKNKVIIKIKDKPSVLAGGPADYLKERFNSLMAICEERVKKNPDLVILYDTESDLPYTATKAEQKRLLDLLESVKPKNGDNPIKGKLIMFGTGGNIDNKGLKEFYEQPFNPQDPNKTS